MALHFSPNGLSQNSFVTLNLQEQRAAKTMKIITPCRRINCSGRRRIEVSESARRSANYKPTIWSHDFVMSLKNDYSMDNTNKEKVKELEKEIRRVIFMEYEGQSQSQSQSNIALLEVIDDIERLGLGYRFESDIVRVLEDFVPLMKGLDDDLHATSLKFRLLRQHGYEISQDVFRRFKDNKGGFMPCLKKDVKGLLSLYEASFLAFEGETILDEAKSFATTHLIQNLESVNDKFIIEHVNHALEGPLHHRAQRLEARWYIDTYKKRKDAYHTLLQLAALDFNIGQSTLQTNLKGASVWWEKVGLASKLSFVRDRLMECFVWSIGMIPEPQYCYATMRLTQVSALITTIDDVYDVYGSMKELELFTCAVKRWDIDAIRDLPDCMIICFLALYNTVNEIASDTLTEGEGSKQNLKRGWAELCEAFLMELKWENEKYMPTLTEYLDNGWRSSSGCLLIFHAFILTNQGIAKETIPCFETYHDLLKSSAMIFRLWNDLATSSAELETGETVNSVSCYVHENGVSEIIAHARIRDLIDDAWKNMNGFRVVDSPFNKKVVEIATNLARIAECTYKYGDGHGVPDGRSKTWVLNLVIQPVVLNEGDNSMKENGASKGLMYNVGE